ncbi:MAG TPA: bifunctional homocysteine S-methyltransferase/methylenetetrahydrofolate reductase, partial [Actinomycetota bacterium]|nr:bifunctional homocysteine S-methyltransferase/methylenetetrahydrofolate reductase [Actinomycetota bacterium]
MDPSAFRALLQEGPLLGDGGLGAALVDRGVGLHACFEDLNRTDPDLVAEVHRGFAEAGAAFVETNTFGANRFNLAKHGLEDRVAELNSRGVEIARRAGVLVVGSVGPLRVHLVPYGRVSRAQAFEAYAEQVSALAEAGADLIFIETQSDLVEMEQALAAARSVTGLAVAVIATFTRDDRTLLGSTPEQVAARLVELGADAVGVNCSEGPAQVLRVAAAMRGVAGDTPVVAMPNAGGPSRVGTRILYPATGEYMGEFARAALAAGVSVVGGCCGTGFGHVRAMADALAEPRQPVLEMFQPVEPSEGAERTFAPTGLQSMLRQGRFVVCVEMEPPKGHSAARLVAGAETLHEAGADVIYVSDSSRARLRMSAWAACRLIQEHEGIETILGFPTRGRNLLRVQGDLLAAHALGLRHLFVCMGDPTQIGDYPAATDTQDIVPTGLMELVSGSLNSGTDQAGTSIGEPTSFVVGCALNLNATDLGRETRLLKRKIDAGADFALCQPIFGMEPLRQLRKAYEERYGHLTLPLIVGAWPLLNSRNAEYLHNEIPGITIPDDVRARMREAGEDGEA